MKKIISILLALLLTAGLVSPVLAVDANEQRVVVGADLTSDQKAQVYSDFGLTQGSVEELTVSISEERSYLENYVSSDKIGSRSLSSIYIITKAQGEGLDISIKNINWLTEDIYVNALTTAGITDAKVIITSPVEVSGTAALTGIYKAYENITGEELSEDAKLAAVEEAVVTGDIANELGDSEDIALLINELKLMIDEIKTMSDDEVRTQINSIAVNLNISLTSAQVEKILSLCRSLENVDMSSLQSTLEAIAGNVSGAAGFFSTIASFFSSIGSSIAGFFSNLFS